MRGKRLERDEEKKIEKKKDSPDPSRSALSHFEGGFPKFLREWIPGFGGRKEGRQRGSRRESYKYECCVLLPFLLSLSLPFLGIVWIGSQSLRVRIVLRLFFLNS